MQALILPGFNNWYLDSAHNIPVIGENSLIEIVSINEQGAIVSDASNGLTHTFIPSKFIDIQGVSNEVKEILTSAWQANQSE